MAKAKVHIDFVETLEGDERDSGNFYWKIKPQVSIEVYKITDAEIKEAVMKALKKSKVKGVMAI